MARCAISASTSTPAAFSAVWSASMSLVEMTMRCRRMSGRLPTVARSTIAVDPPAGATSIQRIFPSANVSSERSSNPSVPWSGSQVRAVCGVRTHVPLRGSRREFGIGADDRVLVLCERVAGAVSEDCLHARAAAKPRTDRRDEPPCDSSGRLSETSRVGQRGRPNTLRRSPLLAETRRR